MGRRNSPRARRRTVLRVVGAATVGGSTFGAAKARASNVGAGIVIEQDGQCSPLEPLSGSDPVEDLYEYRYPTDRFDGPPGSEGTTFSSHGTTDLQRNGGSVLFLYEGPEGVSLVAVHGRVGVFGHGGTVSFAISGLPEDGEWIVRDDFYVNDGESVATNFDDWDVDGDEHVVDWAFYGRRTDGGAFRDLGPDPELRIEPAFNEEAAMSDEHDFGPVGVWEALSGDLDDPVRYPLQLDQPVTIRRGGCSSGGSVDARIEDVSVADGTFTPRDRVPAEVTVANTGDRDHTFYVGYGVVDPQGRVYDDDGETIESLALDAGETDASTVEWSVEDEIPQGPYDARVIVWRDRSGDDPETQLDGRVLRSAFEVRSAE